MTTATIEVDGKELRYLRRGRGPVVVLVHTLRTQLDYFHPLIAALGSWVDVVALDLPGHGRSAAPRARYTAGTFVDATRGFLAALDLRDVIFVGESIGATIGLVLASEPDHRIARVVALNPYDYGRWGGIRRSSGLANFLFTMMLWPGVGSIAVRAATKGIVRRVMAGGLSDPHRLPAELVDELYACGRLPGHAAAFRSLCLEWRTWIAARAAYPRVAVPVVLSYGEHDWSHPEDRSANARDIPGARVVALAECGHFSSLEAPERVAAIIHDEIRVVTAS